MRCFSKTSVRVVNRDPGYQIDLAVWACGQALISTRVYKLKMEILGTLVSVQFWFHWFNQVTLCTRLDCSTVASYAKSSDSSLLNTLNTLWPRQNGRRLADDVFKSIFLNENVWISLEIFLKFVPKVPINYIPALVQILVWRRSGDKPLSEPMMVSLLTHIWITRPQWVKATIVWNCQELVGKLSTILIIYHQYCDFLEI